MAGEIEGAKFTTPPWEASLTADSNEQRQVYGPNHEHVAYVINGSAIPGRTTANAHLIAAAPDLYEALRKIAECHIEFCEGLPSGYGPPVMSAEEMAALAYAALSKASGSRS
jgi:hypothetical protein